MIHVRSGYVPFERAGRILTGEKGLARGHASLVALLWRAGTVSVLLGSAVRIGIGVTAALKLRFCRPAFDAMKSDPDKILRGG